MVKLKITGIVLRHKPSQDYPGIYFEENFGIIIFLSEVKIRRALLAIGIPIQNILFDGNKMAFISQDDEHMAIMHYGEKSA